MQFTQISFAIFFFVIFVLYWLVLRKWHRAQNALLLAGSYVFYGWWDWRFLSLILLTTLTTFFSAKLARRRHGMGITVGNIVLNLSILLLFKYLNFFIENFKHLFGVDFATLDILLPVGISFYTFQAIAYSVDVYKGKIEPCNNLLNFATFIAYFPQLVAGPIERASQLLTQISTKHQWRRDYAVEGLRMVLVGVLKKVCISNMLALYADQYFLNTGDPITALKAGIAFTSQIYVDFSAYSEIARGVSRLLGIELMANFRFPLFSRNIIEFWQRWHISLMRWFRDYVYIPLGGSRRGLRRTLINIAIVFILSGLWHGAAWNYVLWGAYWALAYIVGKALLHLPKRNESIAMCHLPSMILTLGIVSFGFYIFRCEDVTQLMNGLHSVIYYIAFFGLSWLIARCLVYNRLTTSITKAAMVLCLVAWLLRYIILWQTAMADWWLLPALLVFALEWHNRNADYPTAHISDKRYLRYAFYWVCMLAVLISENEGTSFIYFQF